MPKGASTRKTLVLRLYVAGRAPNSMMAIANAKEMCDAHFPAAYTLEIVDLLAEPQRAVDDGIIVTPTLLKVAPPPRQRLIGNLSDTARLLLTLGRA